MCLSVIRSVVHATANLIIILLHIRNCFHSIKSVLQTVEMAEEAKQCKKNFLDQSSCVPRPPSSLRRGWSGNETRTISCTI